MRSKRKLDLKHIESKLKEFGGKVCRVALKRFLPTLMILSFTALAIVKGPESYNKWLRYKVGSKVYYITADANSGGGTGFAVRAPSGKDYILTNDHVCGVSRDGTLLISNDNGFSMRRNIIAHDDASDLCLIEGIPDVKGLSLAKHEPEKGDTINVIGHPKLMPITLTRGEMIGHAPVEFVLGPINFLNPETGELTQIPVDKGGVLPEQCNMSKNRQEEEIIQAGFYEIAVRMCKVHVDRAYITNVTILPGNSGSPAVNSLGQIEGVAFAADHADNWGVMVSLHDIKDFLKNY